MSSDIQFGDLEQSEPQRAPRPDQDGHFVVVEIGEVGTDELKVFVDLDVMRDMEGHARTNTRVELGGVMLGQQSIDDQGRPFVVITDSLRAEHYEATKGSFKFTHDTWSQITRDRKRFRPELEMVGWYHTHPGWSVFLSGMDLFICNNFFNRPLDVALVIDPCAGDRGWFQWTSDARPKTQQTGGFYLITGRYRQQELDYSRIYNKEPIMMQDPRYAGNGIGIGAQPVVNLMDNRKPIFDIAVVAMLLTQFLLFAVIAWKLLTPLDNETVDRTTEQVASLQQQLSDIQQSQQQRVRDQAYEEILQSVVGQQTGDNNLVKSFAELKTANQQLQANIQAQMALAGKLTRENNVATAEIQTKSAMLDNLRGQLVTTREKLNDADLRIAALESSLTSGSMEGPETAGQISIAWWWLAVGTVAVACLGGVLGFVLARNQQDKWDDFHTEPDSGEKKSRDVEIDTVSDRTVKILDDPFGGNADDIPSTKPNSM